METSSIQEPTAAHVVAYFAGALAFLLMPIGLIVITDGLNKLSIALRNRAWSFGLLGANVGLAVSLAVPPSDWVDFFPRTFVALYAGMLSGILFDLKTFLSD